MQKQTETTNERLIKQAMIRILLLFFVGLIGYVVSGFNGIYMVINMIIFGAYGLAEVRLATNRERINHD